MVTFRPEDRVDPPLAADEATTLLAFLRFHRDTLRAKASGLSAEQLDTPLAPTTLTLGGLLKHLAVVEAGWLNRRFAGGYAKPSWFHEIDPDDPDWDLRTASGASPEELFAVLDESVAVSDRIVAQALARPQGLDALSAEPVGDGGEHVSLRWILVHLVEEYARHNGHADLLRQAIDGATGE